MKKYIYFLFTIFSFFLTTPSALAIQPLIMKKAVLDAPPRGDLKRVPDYYSNDIDSVDTVKCHRTLVISNKFDPKETGGQGTAPPTYTKYDVNEIQDTFKFGENNISSNFLERAFYHLGSRVRNALQDKAQVDVAFKTFDGAKSASNSTARSFSYADQNCLKGKRLGAATSLAVDGQEGVNSNEPVACKRNGGFDGISVDYINGCPKDSQVFLSDIAYWLNTNKHLSLGLEATGPDGKYIPGSCATIPESVEYFFPTSTVCNMAVPTPPVPVPLESVVSGVIKTPKITLSPQEACVLFKTAVEAVDVATNTRKVKICSVNMFTGTEDCTNEKVGLPLGNVAAHTELAQLTSYSTTIDAPVDLCSTISDAPESDNQPNRISIIGYIKQFFGTIFDTSQIFTGSIKMTYFIDSRLKTGIEKDNTLVNNLISAKDQKKYATINIPPSSTDKKYAIDPGNPIPREYLEKLLYPAKTTF